MPRRRPARRFDLGAVVALSWLCTALLVTMIFGPMLGLRGWLWLGAHHLLCLAGCAHELRRARRRREAAEAARARQVRLEL